MIKRSLTTVEAAVKRTVASMCLLALGVSASTTWAEEGVDECRELREQLGAEYSVSASDQDDAALLFWRRGNSVLYQYPDRKLAEKWTLTGNGYLKPVRYFIEDERAIEYDAFDINRGKGLKNWEPRSQWFTQEQIDAMELTERSGEGCRRVEVYQRAGVKEGESMIFTSSTLSWMPELKLVESYQVVSATAEGKRVVSTWQLQHVETDADLVAAGVQAYDDFKATDYADIGDNESDPFLMKLIKLGFINHGASGFYQSDGTPLAGGHNH